MTVNIQNKPAYQLPQVIHCQLDMSVKRKTQLVNLRDIAKHHVVSVTIATPLQENLLTTIHGTSKHMSMTL